MKRVSWTTPLSGFVDMSLLHNNKYIGLGITSTSYTPGYGTYAMRQLSKYQHHLHSLGYDAPWVKGLWVVGNTQE